MRQSRRAWLGWFGRAAYAVVVFALVTVPAVIAQWTRAQRYTARPRVDEQPEYVFRPPGALEETEFLARCIHCYLCQDVCPPGCILMKPETEPDRHTPYIAPRVKACTLCLECTLVCPTGALQPITDKTEVRMGAARVDENLCVSHLRTGACGACFTACPQRGLAITQGLYNAPTVHPEHCTGCGLCEEVCIVPYRAIRVFPLDEEPVS